MYGVCRLSPDAPIPSWANGDFVSVTRSNDELSVVCIEEKIPLQIKCEKGWRVLKVMGPLDFSLTGILSSIVKPLADADISIFAISTFDTDYVLVKEVSIKAAKETLIIMGHTII